MKVHIYEHHYTGMGGKDEIANAVLGGGSDYIADIAAGFTKIFLASGDERVSICKDFKV